MSELRILVEAWPLLLSLIGLVVWLVRLEGKTARNKDDIAVVVEATKELWGKYETLNSETLKILTEIREKLARIEGQLSVTGGHS